VYLVELKNLDFKIAGGLSPDVT